MMTLAAYPSHFEYKPSGYEWVGDVPLNWSVEKLGTCLTAVSCKERTDLPLLSITREEGVIERDVDDQESNHNFIPDDLTNYKVLRAGQFGMNKMKAWQGSYGISAHTGIVSPAYFVFDITREVDPAFFNRALRSKLYVSYFAAASDGVRIGQWDLSKTRMRQIPVLLPPLPEQRAIASFLDEKCAKIDDAVRIKEAQIALLRERRQILIQQAVTRGLNPDAPMKDSGIDWIGQIPAHWEVTKLKYAADIFRGKFTHRPRNDPRLYDGAYPFFQTGDVARAGMFLSEFKQTLNEKGLRVSTLIPKGTILITIAANIGDVAILGIDGCFPDSVVGFKPKTMIERDFLYYSMSSMKRVFLDSSIANAQANLNVDRIGVIAFCIPPRNEQAKIVNYIAVADRKIGDGIAIKQDQITALKEYKTCLINAAVTGKIKVA
ncbi:MAG: restriction endonuclease subunit S [Chromatiaceae bacterium]|nr:restriction endonuclease subunit S [Chromatiaceae bacterium]